MNIKDPEVHRLAAQLARRWGTSMTGAVRQALEEAVDRETRDREDRLERLLAISRRSAERIRAEGIVLLTDDDLYDERGLPR
jgi:antitoxin VapB